jgi:3-phosphoglycerate kinase
VEVKGKVVIVRVDFNLPIDPETKRIIDDSGIRAHGESTIKELSRKRSKGCRFGASKDGRGQKFRHSLRLYSYITPELLNSFEKLDSAWNSIAAKKAA